MKMTMYDGSLEEMEMVVMSVKEIKEVNEKYDARKELLMSEDEWNEYVRLGGV